MIIMIVFTYSDFSKPNVFFTFRSGDWDANGAMQRDVLLLGRRPVSVGSVGAVGVAHDNLLALGAEGQTTEAPMSKAARSAPRLVLRLVPRTVAPMVGTMVVESAAELVVESVAGSDPPSAARRAARSAPPWAAPPTGSPSAALSAPASGHWFSKDSFGLCDERPPGN